MPTLIDLTGMRFGKWTVVSPAPRKSGHTMWHCRCECGNERDVSGVALKSGRTVSCGCIRSPDLTGQRFGRLVVISKEGQGVGGVYLWKCRCDCGNEKTVSSRSLKNGHTRSCGCLNREIAAQRNRTHGETDSRLYNIWHDMKARCGRSKDACFYRYGGRGISICEEWRNSFESFYEWAIHNGYSDELTIDRIDNNGNYEPGNCRWVDIKTQSNNKSNNRLITVNGETHTVSEWAELLNSRPQTIFERLRRGWSEFNAVTIPVRTIRRKNHASTEHIK